jgi:hypothetical protein
LNTFKYIKNTFLQLTRKTYPHGTEDDLVKEMTKRGIFPNLEKDSWGNYFLKIGNSRTMFAAHLDTVTSKQVDITQVIDKQQVVSSDGKSILGADDKAGVTILLYLIENNIPGLYYFFIGEEVGCVGSSQASVYGKFEGKYDRVISFDRRGTNSVITFQGGSRCCSVEFANELCNQLNSSVTNFFYKPDDGGVYTDSAEFMDVISECTNISVGYMNEHTTYETQDLFHLNKLAQAVIKVDWENLPTKRDYLKRESKYSYFKHEPFKKTRRSRKVSTPNKGKRSDYRHFYDSGFGTIQEFDFKKPGDNALNGLIDKFLTSDLKREELEIVKELYLDMNNPVDKRVYDKLKSVL